MSQTDSPPERRIEIDKGAILVRPEHAQDVAVTWFAPEFWGQSAAPVENSGGRGSAWFVDNGERQWVLRHYSRGGMVARISRRSYLYTGGDRVRSFAEFRLLNRLHGQALPVPVPVAAYFQRFGACLYCAGIIVERIPGASPLADYLNREESDLWFRVGRLIRRFHDAGLHHTDLNCHNILVADQALYLIDFDKCALRAGDTSAAWKRDNLQRFRRSIRKLGGGEVLERCWPYLEKGYGIYGQRGEVG